jgi:hypothetical protein
VSESSSSNARHWRALRVVRDGEYAAVTVLSERDRILTTFSPLELHDYVEMGGHFPTRRIAETAMKNCGMTGGISPWPFDDGYVYKIIGLRVNVVTLKLPEPEADIRQAESARKSA